MPPDSPAYLTPPETARLLRVKPDKVISLIRSGELKASNVASRLSGRPRFRIAAADLEAFLDLRAAAAVDVEIPRSRRRRRPERPHGWVSYFNMEAAQ